MTERHSEIKVIRWTDRIQDVLAGKVRGPIRANLDLTNLCSHHCFFCEPVAFREATIADRKHTLSAEVARDVLDDLRTMDCRAVTFSGGGEPTLHPEFGDLLFRAHNLGMRTLVVTHGGFIRKWLMPLTCAADHVRVSLDASCQDEHQQMHRAKEGEFDKIIEGIKSLTSGESNGGRKPEVGVTYTVTDHNSGNDSLHRILKLAGEMAVDYVQFRPISEAAPESFTQDWGLIARRIRYASLERPQVRVMITGQRWKDVFLQRNFEKCHAALTLAVISANGDVAACCDRRDVVFGNVYERRFGDIWLSDEHRRVAAQIVPRFCQRCLQCGTNEGIERFVVHNEALVEVL